MSSERFETAITEVRQRRPKSVARFFDVAWDMNRAAEYIEDLERRLASLTVERDQWREMAQIHKPDMASLNVVNAAIAGVKLAKGEGP